MNSAQHTFDTNFAEVCACLSEKLPEQFRVAGGFLLSRDADGTPVRISLEDPSEADIEALITHIERFCIHRRWGIRLLGGPGGIELTITTPAQSYTVSGNSAWAPVLMPLLIAFDTALGEEHAGQPG